MEFTSYSEELDLQKYWLVIKRRWLPATLTFASFLALGFYFSFQERVVYRAESDILIKTDKSSELTGLRNNLGQIDSVNNDPLSTEAQIISSRPILEGAINKLGIKDREGKPQDIGLISSGLNVKQITGTDILEISYQGEDARLVAKVVNSVVEAYIENDVFTNRSEAVAAREFIEKQLPKVEEAVNRAERQLRIFKEDNNIANLQGEAERTLTTIGSLESQMAQTQALLADTNAQYGTLRDQVDMNLDEAIAASAVSQSNGVQQALTTLQELQVQLADERSRLTDGNPQIVSLQEREAALNSVVQERINNTLGNKQAADDANLQMGNLQQGLIASFVDLEVRRSGLVSQLETLRQTHSSYKKRLEVLPKLEERQRELERQVQAAQSTYETLLKKLQETKVAEQQNVGNVRVISRAIKPSGSMPTNSNLIVVAGGSVGILMGMALAFLIDILDKSVKTVKEAKELFGYTMLGVIPSFDKSGKIRPVAVNSDLNIPRVIARDMSQSPVREAYQMLQANLKYLSSDEKIKSIVVASSVSGEGKSEVSANLAASMAQVGRRVLLVDADMRQPIQHHIWGLTNAVGLSNTLISEAEWHEVTQEVMPGLDVITSGVVPPNPVALLDSRRMARLVEVFSQNYDYIIFDTPPLVGLADTTILGKMTDGMLLVVRPGVVDSASASAAKEMVTRTNQKLLGMVANGIAVNNEPDSYFFYKADKYSKRNQASLERV